MEQREVKNLLRQVAGGTLAVEDALLKFKTCLLYKSRCV